MGDPYKVIIQSPYPNSWLNELRSISQCELKFREGFSNSMKPLICAGPAEIAAYSVKGLLIDRPSLEILRKRIRILGEMVPPDNVVGLSEVINDFKKVSKLGLSQ